MKIEPDRSKLPIEPKPDAAEEIASNTVSKILDSDVIERAQTTQDLFQQATEPVSNAVQEASQELQAVADQKQMVQTMHLDSNEDSGMIHDFENDTEGIVINIGGSRFEQVAVGTVDDGEDSVAIDFGVIAKNQFIAGFELGPGYSEVDGGLFFGAGVSEGGTWKVDDAAEAHGRLTQYVGIGAYGGYELGFHDDKFVAGLQLGVALGVGGGIDIGFGFDPSEVLREGLEDLKEKGEVALQLGEWLIGIGEGALGGGGAAGAAGTGGNVVDDVVDAAEDVVDDVVDTAEDVGEAAGDLAEDGAEAASNAVSDAADW